MAFVQAFIHAIEVGGGMRYFKFLVGALALIVITVVYDMRCWKNLSSSEAMDAAQLGRNIASGKGYTTFFIRPLSMFLIKKQREQAHGSALAPLEDPYLIKRAHPDIANPPAYPVFLAALMKVLPFHYKIPDTPKAFWNNSGFFWRYQPDFLITLANQVLFFAVIVSTFFLSQKLFGGAIAWMTAVLLLANELLWRFSASGLSTMLLLLIFTGILWCLVSLDDPEPSLSPTSPMRPILIAAGLGLLCGIGALTLYSFGWLLAPVILYVVLFGGSKRFVQAGIVAALFLVVFTPWLVRNYSISGNAFGTAGYALIQGTTVYPEHQLERSLNPEFNDPLTKVLGHKFLLNARKIVETDLPAFAGGWIAAFFLISLLIPFRFQTVARLKYFILFSLGAFVLVQSLGRTQLSEDSPGINSENLLILLAPIATAYGISVFFLFLDQLELPTREVRLAVIGLFAVVFSLPMILNFLPPKSSPWSYPPYHPPSLQAAARWTREDDLAMSDLPWATAWYGRSQCVWLTMKLQPDFFTINDYYKPLQELYLTHQTLDGKFTSMMQGSIPNEWLKLALDSALRRSQGQTGPPPSMPLHYWQLGWPDLYLLTAREKPFAP